MKGGLRLVWGINDGEVGGVVAHGRVRVGEGRGGATEATGAGVVVFVRQQPVS
jgi:hypothetical protein